MIRTTASFLLLWAVGLMACGPKEPPPPPEPVSRTETLEPYVGIQNLSPLDLKLAVGETHSLELTCVPDVLPLIRFGEKKGVVVLELPAEATIPEGAVCEAVATAPEFRSVMVDGSGDLSAGTLVGLHRLDGNGSGDVTIERIETEKLAVSSQGSGVISVAAAQVPTLNIRNVGSGDIVLRGLEGSGIEFMEAGTGDTTLAGDAEGIVVKTQASGDLDASALTTEHAAVTSRGKGDVRVHASESFNGVLTDSGDIVVSGKPAKRQANASGLGSISYE